MISIVIPTFNRAPLLERAIASIYANCKISDFELLVCDNNSSDYTKSVVEKFQDKFNNIRYFLVRKPGLHEGRHTGYLNARFEIISYLDDDVEVGKSWLNSIIATFKNRDVALVGGKCLPNFESTPQNDILKRWKRDKIILELSVVDLGNEIKEISPYYVFGCNFSVRKVVLQQSSGFHPDGMPKHLLMYRGDGESHIASWLSEKKTWKTHYHPEAMIYHFVSNSRMTSKYFKTNNFRAGISHSFTEIRSGGKGWLNVLLMFMNNLKDYFLIKGYHRYQVKGFLFHQYHYLTSRKLRSWVARDNYL